MPMYDLKCANGHEQYNLLLKIGERPLCPICQEATEILWKNSTIAAIGDECDVWIRHGICHENGEPRHFNSKAEMVRAAKEKGLINVVRHVPTPGSDKSPHTVRWTAAPAILTPADQLRHTQEWWDDEEKRNPSVRREDFGVPR